MEAHNTETWFLDPTLSPRAFEQGLSVGELIMGIRYMAQIGWSLIDAILYAIVFAITRTNLQNHSIVALAHLVYLFFFLIPTLARHRRFLISLKDFSIWFTVFFILFQLVDASLDLSPYGPFIESVLLALQGLVLSWKILAHPKVRALVPIMHIAFRKLLFQTVVICLICYRVVRVCEYREVNIGMIASCAFLVGCLFISAIVEARANQLPYLRFVDIMPERRLLLDAFISFKFGWLFYRIVGSRPVTLERALLSSGLAHHEILTRDYFIDLFGDVKGPEVFDLMLQFAVEALGRSELSNNSTSLPAGFSRITNSYTTMS